MFCCEIHAFALIPAFDTINISCSDQQSYEVLKGFFAKPVDTMPDGSVSSPMKDDEKHLIRILLESFASNRLGAPNCKVSRVECVFILLTRHGLPWGAAAHVGFPSSMVSSWVLSPALSSPLSLSSAGDQLARQALYSACSLNTNSCFPFFFFHLTQFWGGSSGPRTHNSPASVFWVLRG